MTPPGVAAIHHGETTETKLVVALVAQAHKGAHDRPWDRCLELD
jgi:hypothetical protein